MQTPSANTLRLLADGADFDYSDAASSAGLLDSSYLSGTYTFAISTLHEGARSAALSLPSPVYPSAPHLINFDAAQSLRANEPFRFQWDPWPEGTEADFVQLRIEDNDNNKMFETSDITETGALNGRATSATVPSGTLIPGKSYRGRIYFYKVAVLDTTTYPAVLGIAAVYTKTKFDVHTAPPDVKSFSVSKGHEFVQSSSAAPTPTVSTAFVFTASVVATDAGTVNSASVLTPRGVTVPLRLQDDGKTFALRDGCDDQVQVDAAYPDGSYTLQINTVNEGVRNVSLSLSGATYPNAPRLNNFDQMQLVESGLTLFVRWDPFAGGATNDFIFVEFDDVFGNIFYITRSYGKSGALDGIATTLAVPNGTFQESQLYRGALLFEKIMAATQSGYPGALGISGYFSRTRFNLTTRGAGNPPSLDAWQISTNAAFSFNINGLLGASYRVDCSSNLVQWVPLQTISAAAKQTLFVDPQSATRPCFFYRAVLLP